MKIRLSLLLILALLPMTGMAKDLSLLDKPENGAAVVTQLNHGDELITIFSPKDSDWIKVADPRNGKVGWIKRSDLSVNDTQATVTNHKPDAHGLYRQKIDRKHRDQNGRVTGQEHIEYYGTEQLSQDQIEKMVKRMHEQQARMHQMMNHLWDLQTTDPFDDPFFNHPFNPSSPVKSQYPKQNRPDRIIAPQGDNKSDQYIR